MTNTERQKKIIIMGTENAVRHVTCDDETSLTDDNSTTKLIKTMTPGLHSRYNNSGTTTTTTTTISGANTTTTPTTTTSDG